MTCVQQSYTRHCLRSSFRSRRADCRVRITTQILAEMKLIMTITFAVFTLASSACVKKDGGPVQCCNQRAYDGSLHCCAGKNNSCYMSTAGFVNRSTCFCDEHCRVAGDCCPDFESFNKTCGLGKLKSKCVLCNLQRAC